MTVLCAVVSPAPGQDLARRLGVDFIPQKLGERRVLVGETVTETTSVATWHNPRVSIDVYDRGFSRRLGSGSAEVSGRGQSRIAVTSYRLDSAGSFAILRKIDGLGSNDGARHRYGFYWGVDAHWPVVAAPPDSVYYYGENALFSFAAGHMDQRAYSYEVVHDGEVVLRGEGSVIPIEPLWRARLSGMGEFQLRGYYRGSPFIFTDSSGSERRESIWSVRVEVPAQRELVSLWYDSSQYEALRSAGTPPALDMHQSSAFLNPLQFRFAVSGPFYEGLYLLPAGISRVEATSDPPGFLPPDPTRSTRVQTERDGLWHVIELQPVELFLERCPPDAPVEVTLRLRVQDEFGRITLRTFKSRIFSSRY